MIYKSLPFLAFVFLSTNLSQASEITGNLSSAGVNSGQSTTSSEIAGNFGNGNISGTVSNVSSVGGGGGGSIVINPTQPQLNPTTLALNTDNSNSGGGGGQVLGASTVNPTYYVPASSPRRLASAETSLNSLVDPELLTVSSSNELAQETILPTSIDSSNGTYWSNILYSDWLLWTFMILLAIALMAYIYNNYQDNLRNNY